MKNSKQKLYDLLRWSEKYTKTDMVYLSSGGLWITIGNIISSIGSFFLVIAFANLLSPQDYGIYRYVVSVAAILLIPSLTGMNTAVTQAIAKGFEGLYIEGFKTKIKWGLLGGGASLFLAGYYYLNDNTTLSIAFLITTIFLPFMDAFKLYGSYYDGKKLFKQSAWYGVIISIIRVGVILIVLFFTQNLFLIIFTDFISTTLMRFIFFWLVIKKQNLNNKKDVSTITYGKHLSLMTVLGTISTQLDKMLLFTSIGAVELAVYSFATAPVTRISNLLAPLIALSFPKFSENNPETLKKTLPKKLLYLFAAVTLITGIYIILTPLFYKILFPNYTDSIIYSQIFALSLLFFPQKLIASALTAQKQQKALYVITTISPIVKILSLIILLPLFGIWGAITAILLPLAINGILSIYYFKKM